MSTLKVGTIQDHANSNTATSIHSAGRVTQPAKPYFSYTNSGTSVANGAQTILKSDTLVDQVGGHYSTSTGMFTAPVTGLYLFTGQVKHNDAQSYWYFDHLDSSNSRITAYIKHQRGSGSNGTTESSGSHIQHMVAGEKMATGMAHFTSTHTVYGYFAGYLVS